MIATKPSHLHWKPHPHPNAGHHFNISVEESGIGVSCADCTPPIAIPRSLFGNVFPTNIEQFLRNHGWYPTDEGVSFHYVPIQGNYNSGIDSWAYRGFADMPDYPRITETCPQCGAKGETQLSKLVCPRCHTLLENCCGD